MSDTSESSPAGKWTGWARSHRRLASLLAHLLLFALSWFVAFGLLYKTRLIDIEAWFFVFFLPLLPAVVAIKLLVFGLLGLYRTSWRYVSMRDVAQISKGSFISFVWVFVIVYGAQNLEFVVRHNPIDQPVSPCSTGIETLAQQNHLLRGRYPGHMGDPLCSHDYPDAEPDLGQAEDRALTGNAEVTAQGQDQSTPDAETVQPRNRWLLQRLELIQTPLKAQQELTIGLF